MTTPATPPIDTDDLPPTQYLILEVLAARHRTGETLWTFPARIRSHVEQLADIGLVGWKSGVVPKTVMVWLTGAGKAAALSDTYVPPNTEWSWRHNRYISTRSATTDRAEAEQSVARCRAANPGDPVALVRRTVTDWTDAAVQP